MLNKIQFLFILSAFSAVFSFNPNNPYCVRDRCPRGKHTMCQYEVDEPADGCGRVYRYSLSKRERKKILDLHNYYKTNVYLGKEERGPSGPQPRGTDFQLFSWDKELETIAQRWSFQCSTDIERDACNHVDRFYVGLNYVVADYTPYMTDTEELELMMNLVTSWYNEVERFDANYVPAFNFGIAHNTTTFHYTQLIWGDSYLVGCGTTKYRKHEEGLHKILFVCMYGPRGNIDQSEVYGTDGDEIKDYRY